MNDRKRERHRRKSAEKRKQKARTNAQEAQLEARRWKSFTIAERAEEHLERGEVAEAVRAAAHAAELNPRDPSIADLYYAAAERSGDVADRARALEHVSRLTVPDTRLFANLGYLHLQSGDIERAERAVRRARELLPARMKDRKHWRSLIEFVESSVAWRAGVGSEPASVAAPPSARAPSPAREPRKKQSPRKKPERPREASESPPDTASSPRPASPETDPGLAAPAVLEIALDIASDVDGLDILASATFSDPEEVRLAVLAATLRAAESYDRLLAVEGARGLLSFSHQEDTARKVLAVFLGRALLADEVGLGKTIEAGLILSEYLLRGRVERALVLVPPSLVGQWREELSAKFGIDARTTEDASFRANPGSFWAGTGVIIASLATARSPRQRDGVTANPWDLVIIDEAHALKNAATESYLMASRITSRFLLLLTATPVENRIEELYNLVSLLRPGQLGGRAAFLRRFSDAKVRASEAARAEIRRLLGEVMIRNTRALSGVPLPPRFARTVLVQPDPDEGELYAHLAAALRALGAGGRIRLLLSVLLQEAGSSPFAVRGTLEKIASNDGHAASVADALAPAIRSAGRADSTGKAAALLRVLDGAAEPTVVFTRFRATLDFLSTVLGKAGIVHERFDGHVPPSRRHEAIARIRQRGGVLLSTEVGAEGLNLQFCQRIVNFDLPWNPMRIEQRIGRVHRIGQDHAVDVVNFCLAGSIEERILTILDERINLFEMVIGEAEMILGYLEDERAFEDLMLDAFAESDETGRDRSFDRIADALAAARTRYENVKRFDEEFFRNELGV